MRNVNEMQREYEAIAIPDELEQCVHKGIQQGRVKYRHQRLRHQRLRHQLSMVAACFVVVTASLNLFAPVAAAAADIPVLGRLFEVLTVREFSDVDKDRTLTIRQPALTGTDFSEQISAEIQQRVAEKIAEGEVMIAEGKEAFLTTGGTEEQWAQRETTVSVDYEIKSQTESRVSFVIDSYVSLYSAYQEQFYYNLDMAAGRELTLQDILGEEWVTLCNNSIRTQMEQSDDPSVYFDETMGGFTTVDETTAFYINEEGKAVVVFPRGTVAIGAMGTVEFVIRAES